MMSFLSAVITSCYPTTNNQLRNSSNPRQQATINDGRVTLQPIQGRQISFTMGTSRTYTPGASGSNSGKQRTVICYNYKGEGHMSKQCTKPKRKRDDLWFKDKVLLVQAQANGQILHEEELAFLADPGIVEDALAEKAQHLEPKLYDGNVIKNTSAITIPDSKETLMLAKESHSKMILKQKDLMILEKKNFVNSLDPTLSSRPTKVEVLKELPKVSIVNTNLKKLKYHLAGFDVVVKERTMVTAITEGSWGLQEKVLVITALKDDLRKLKGKSLVDNAVMKHIIDLKMLKINVEPITPKLLNNKIALSAYIKHTQEEACQFLGIRENTNIKQLFFIKPVSNKPMLSSKRVKRYLVPSGSQPLGNTKKDKIQRTPSSTQKNKVEAYPRTVKSSLRNKNCFVEPKGTVNVQHSKLNANSEPLCVKCNEKFKEKSLETKGNCSQILDTPGDLLVVYILFYGIGLLVAPKYDQRLLSGTHQIGNVTISRFYYVEGLGHNLFSVRQLCDLNLEVAFHQHTCFIRNLEGVDLLTGS
ncbi:hypothetical protein Tco_0853236 [Tanacetum coccineum]